MKTGRPTPEKKDSTIKLRLSDEMRAWIEEMACGKGISMSEYIRLLIDWDMGGGD